MTRHRQPVEPRRGSWFLTTRAELDEWARKRWATLSALMEAERTRADDEPEQEQLELQEAA
jgi:hypothetical protein